ncbi:DUF177 domain-containing protein [Secundilactobacillus kimchicus]|uniref:DUF177 domain-containing protein n=1 Tax=Secundilactobacillus kimchicus TaxID=528209 RepID=UPI001C022B20|nr:DUF177 domain-containing protein [Secundilactobacillus kimchicus]
MEFTLSDLRKNNRHEPQKFDTTLDLKKTLTERVPDEVLDLSPVAVSGLISVESSGDALLYAKVKATLTVPSTRSLVPVTLACDFDFTEFYVDSKAALNRYDATDVVIVAEDGVIDLDTAVADNLLLQIPMQVLSPEEQKAQTMPKGKGWEVTREGDESADAQSVDPRLAKLKDFYKDSQS